MILSDFQQLYPLSKTLRFELKPIAQTLVHIQAKNFLMQDEELSQAYEATKLLLNEYHRDFIEQAMQDVQLAFLDEYVEVYKALKANSKDTKLKTAFQKVQDKLRKNIVACFKKDEATKIRYKGLFTKELFKGGKDELGDLENWLIERYGQDDDRRITIKKFEQFTTYFTGFYKNRKNMYTDKAIHTAIAYRLVHENLPRYIDNMNILNKIAHDYPELYQQIGEKLDVSILASFDDFDIEKLSTLDFYNQLLSQTGITAYNVILGGKVNEHGIKLQGINELINLYNQQKKPKLKIAKLKPLHKQILSDKQSLSFLPKKFENDANLCSAVNDFYRSHYKDLYKLSNLLQSIKDYNLDTIYINHTQLNTLSKLVYGDYALLSQALDLYYSKTINKDFDIKLAKAKTDKAKDKLYKEKQNYIKAEHSLAELQHAAARYIAVQDTLSFSDQAIVDYFAQANNAENIGFMQAIDNKHSTIKGFLELERAEGESVLHKHKESHEVNNLKLFLDAVLEYIHFAKLLVLGTNSNLKTDEAFYGEFTSSYDSLSKFSLLYNKVRDYIAQKPYSIEKYKLNFGNATLLNGWDVNKEKDNFGIILRKNGLYYLALLDAKHKKVFEQAPVATSNDCYEKMVYKQLSNLTLDFPHVFFAEKNRDDYNPSEGLLENYKNETHKKGDSFNLADCHALINFFKVSIAKHPEWGGFFNLSFSETSSYQDLSDFYNEAEKQFYQIKFTNIDSHYIDDLVAQGKLYLFQIYSKDFSEKSYGKKNLHTLYFTELFSAENIQKVIYKLNGEAEMFYRSASLRLEDTHIHGAGEVLQPKNPNYQVTRQLDYDVIKNKRYTEDKFLLHVPITLNFGVKNTESFNTKVNQVLQTAQKTCVIGIDRGERHLLYLTVIDQDGKLLQQTSLNHIENQGYNGQLLRVPYHTLLNNKEKKRANARVHWGEIENIKELKTGYLSQVVHKIAMLMVQYAEQGYAPIIALEDLNFGFKRGRFKVEKQVYQKFENALIKKLNFLVLKDKATTELGGLRHALQLTNKFKDVKSIGKQTGFIFYVPAWNTSKIDPATGFVDLLKPKYENIEQAQAFIKGFDSIRFNTEKDYFEFAIDYAKFSDKIGIRTQWLICSHGEHRYVYDKSANKGKGATVAIHVNQCLKTLFEELGIVYQQGQDLRQAIATHREKALLSKLIYLLRILLALRYSNASSEEDFILSPVANAQGQFFDSRIASDSQPKDADANGAYHIALKGLWVVRQIQHSEDLDKVNLILSNQQWLQYAQNRF
ncbi:type V CRISPR-associated protein Cas12a/Cpf1 [Acinetobacter sp. c2-A9]|uniref:type V CRISPR-associated protein Cas12a/Cpf1 n=1 Tax=Acinetobacter sp. c2-A9 TaxID=3342802 RepID=UPI0035BA6354